jgi:hypothetical protein
MGAAVAKSTQPLARSARTGTVLSAGGSRPADIIELIMADHRRVRRLREALSDTARYSGGSGSDRMLAHVWQRLSGLLEVHARAEEEICYLPMFGSTPQAIKRMRDAVGDHDDIGRRSAKRLCNAPAPPCGGVPSGLPWQPAPSILSAKSAVCSPTAS